MNALLVAAALAYTGTVFVKAYLDLLRDAPFTKDMAYFYGGHFLLSCAFWLIVAFCLVAMAVAQNGGPGDDDGAPA